MRLSCPTCNQIVRASEDDAGQVISCPTCGSQMRVPGEPTAGPSRPSSDDWETPYVSDQPRRRADPHAEPPPAPRRRRDSWDDEWDDRPPRAGGWDDDYPTRRRRESSNPGMAIAGLVLGIVGILFSWCVLIGPICGVLGIIFGSIHLGQKQREGNGMATAGIATGAGGILIFIIFVIISIANRQPLFMGGWR